MSAWNSGMQLKNGNCKCMQKLEGCVTLHSHILILQNNLTSVIIFSPLWSGSSELKHFFPLASTLVINNSMSQVQFSSSPMHSTASHLQPARKIVYMYIYPATLVLYIYLQNPRYAFHLVELLNVRKKRLTCYLPSFFMPTLYSRLDPALGNFALSHVYTTYYTKANVLWLFMWTKDISWSRECLIFAYS